MSFGYFDDARREYVITTPKTPVRWINYIGTRDFGGFVDQVGSGVICKEDPGLNRIVKYLPQRPQADFNGETVYVREKVGNTSSSKNQYRYFSPFFAPTLKQLDFWQCRVGLGYNNYDILQRGIRIRITVFVPPGANYVVRRYQVTNESDQPKSVELIPVVEFSHFDALKQFTNADWVPQTMQAKMMKYPDGTIAGVSQSAFMQKYQGENWFAAVGAPIKCFETDRENFLGDYGFGGWANPAMLNMPIFSNTEALRGNNIAALLLDLGEIAPGQIKEAVTLLGQSPIAVKEISNFPKWGSPSAVENGLKKLSAQWDSSLDQFQIMTPSKAMNSLINIHNARQCRMTANWSRYLSLYQLGLGARGMGFRDTSQDVMGILHAAPEEAKKLLKTLLSVQKNNGSAMHQFFPLTLEANEGDSREDPDRPNYYSDDHLWAIMAVCAYIKETGDYQFLDEVIDFYEKDKNDKPLESAPVREHLKRGLQFTREHRGSRGFPLLGYADWNDTINLPTGAESLMTANLYGTALKEVTALLEYLNSFPKEANGVKGDAVLLNWTREAWSEMSEIVQSQGWDGEWWRRYYDQNGDPIGSQSNKYGKLWLNGQSWPVISGFATGEKAIKAMDIIYEQLNTRHGIKLSWPGYDGYDEEIGGASSYPPGAKENGGIFLHSNPWAMIAETILGRGDRAWQYYEQINPASRNDKIEEFEVEPYCYPQNILGDEHPQHGLGRNSWLSGTASWCWQAATQYILGIMPVHGGLKIDPCIPSKWRSFTVKRVFQGTEYNISLSNPKNISKGIASITVDDKLIKGNIIPLQKGSPIVHVKVEMG